MKLTREYRTLKIGDNVVVNLGIPGLFSGVISGIKHTHSKVWVDVSVYPFPDEPHYSNHEVIFKDIDSYFVEFPHDRFKGISNIGVKNFLS